MVTSSGGSWSFFVGFLEFHLPGTPLRRVTNRLSSRGRGSTNILGEYPAELFFADNLTACTAETSMIHHVS